MARLLRAAPELAQSWLKRSFELAACADLERYLLPRMTGEDFLRRVEVRGLENLDTALSRGKGAILYSGHVWSSLTFPFALCVLRYKVNWVGRRSRGNPTRIEYWLHTTRKAQLLERVGCRFLWIEPDNFGVAVQATNALRRNEVVIILTDLSFSKQNTEVLFLRQQMDFPSAPVFMAQITGAPLLDFFVHRMQEWVPQIAEIGSPYYAADDLVGAAQHCASRLEEKILQHPSEWVPWLAPDAQLWRNRT